MWRRCGIVAAALCSFNLAAPACSCAGGYASGECRLPTADTIVLATVLSIDVKQSPPVPIATGPAATFRRPGSRTASSPTISAPDPWDTETVTLRVSERFRGDSGDLLVVRTASQTTACGYPFRIGHDYLVFADKFQGSLTVTTCFATRPAKMMASRIRQFRAVRDGTPLPDLFGFIGTHPDQNDLNSLEQVEPLPNLVVTAGLENQEYRTQTGADGTYEFRGLPPGTYKISAEAPGGRLALWGGGAGAVGNWTGSGCPVDFAVSWDGRISGTVLDRLGQPGLGRVCITSGNDRLRVWFWRNRR